jgi:hypothetical protein
MRNVWLISKSCSDTTKVCSQVRSYKQITFWTGVKIISKNILLLHLMRNVGLISKSCSDTTKVCSQVRSYKQITFWTGVKNYKQKYFIASFDVKYRIDK